MFPSLALESEGCDACELPQACAAANVERWLCIMTRPIHSSMAFLPTACPCRLFASLCTLLTLWAAFDSQILLLASSGNASPVSQGPTSSQEEDDADDYVLDLTGSPVPRPGLRRNIRLPSPRLHLQTSDTRAYFSLSSHRQPAPTTPVCEHAFRNGIGAPLLC